MPSDATVRAVVPSRIQICRDECEHSLGRRFAPASDCVPEVRASAGTEVVAGYHEATLAERVAHEPRRLTASAAVKRTRSASTRCWFHCSRAAKELWKFCNIGDVEVTAGQLLAMVSVVGGSATRSGSNWWEDYAGLRSTRTGRWSEAGALRRVPGWSAIEATVRPAVLTRSTAPSRLWEMRTWSMSSGRPR